MFPGINKCDFMLLRRIFYLERKIKMHKSQSKIHDSFKDLPKIGVTSVIEHVAPLNIKDLFPMKSFTPQNFVSVTSVAITPTTPPKEIGVTDMISDESIENKELLLTVTPITSC